MYGWKPPFFVDDWTLFFLTNCHRVYVTTPEPSLAQPGHDQIGGVMIMGDRGTGKTTTIRGAKLLTLFDWAHTVCTYWHMRRKSGQGARARCYKCPTYAPLSF